MTRTVMSIVLALATAIGGCGAAAPASCAGDGDCSADASVQRDSALRADAAVPSDASVCAQRDLDHDGHDAVACGGDDCDDIDPLRFPGATELCDSSGLDEDCDPSTYGVRDADGDGVVDATCCNTDESGASHCGADCDDLAPGVHPTAGEICNDDDDDCDGATDEGVRVMIWPDADDDLHGDAHATPTTGCADASPHTASVGDDCDDTAVSIHPGAAEVCDSAMRDENCDGTANEGCGCAPVGGTQSCCAGRSTQTCVTTPTGSTWDECPVHTSGESCNGTDDDCNGAVDDGALCSSGQVCMGSSGCRCPGSQTLCGTCMDLGGACDNGHTGLCRQTGTWTCTSGSPTCALSAPVWPGDLHYSGDDSRLGHQIGSAGTGSWGESGQTGFLQYGPYIELPAGNYEARFSYTMGPGVVFTLDVTANTGTTPLSGSGYTGASGAPWSVDGYTRVAFTVPSACIGAVEWRVLVQSTNGSLVVHSTDVVRL